MSAREILNQVVRHDLPRSLEIFAPELILCGTILFLLLAKMGKWDRKVPLHIPALLGAMLVFIGVFTQFIFLKSTSGSGVLTSLYSLWQLSPAGVGTEGPYFTGLMTHDLFAVFLRLILSLFLVLFTALTIITGVPDREDTQDFYTLVFGASLGMMLATGANHLLVLFLAIEMMSLPGYMLIAFHKGQRRASEGAIKYVVYGAGAAGVMLYGISLIAGVLGTAELPALASRAMLVLDQGGLTQNNSVALTLLLGILMVLSGLAFKLALVPFHFWCPDAFEGALSEVAAFLSVASKVASFALLIRFLLAFQGNGEVLQELSLLLGIVLGVAGIISTSYGNLAAYQQNNLKRLLAYSTIAQSGYMVMAVSAMMVFLSAPVGTILALSTETAKSLEGMIYYLVVYLFMNLSAFACVALIRNEISSEELQDWKGLFKGDLTTRLVCLCLALNFVSLIGIPPLGGFFAKFMIFNAVYTAGSIHWFLWVVLGFGALNTVLSVFYYFRVLRAIFLEEPDRDRKRFHLQGAAGVFLVMCTLPVVLLGASPLMADLSETARWVATSLLP